MCLLSFSLNPRASFSLVNIQPPRLTVHHACMNHPWILLSLVNYISVWLAFDMQRRYHKDPHSLLIIMLFLSPISFRPINPNNLRSYPTFLLLLKRNCLISSASSTNSWTRLQAFYKPATEETPQRRVSIQLLNRFTWAWPRHWITGNCWRAEWYSQSINRPFVDRLERKITHVDGLSNLHLAISILSRSATSHFRLVSEQTCLGGEMISPSESLVNMTHAIIKVNWLFTVSTATAAFVIRAGISSLPISPTSVLFMAMRTKKSTAL